MESMIVEATDLMIGDWVCFDGDEHHEYPVQIDGISKEEAGVDGDWLDIWDPIPLTPEILEKNGFAYSDLPFEDYYEGYGLCIRGGNYADGHSNWYIICGQNVSMNVTYVHKLQQALRLCGIDKEISI